MSLPFSVRRKNKVCLVLKEIPKYPISLQHTDQVRVRPSQPLRTSNLIRPLWVAALSVFKVGFIVNFVCLLFPNQSAHFRFIPFPLSKLSTCLIISIYDWTIFNSVQLKFEWKEGLPYGVLIKTSAHEFAAQE